MAYSPIGKSRAIELKKLYLSLSALSQDTIRDSFDLPEHVVVWSNSTNNGNQILLWDGREIIHVSKTSNYNTTPRIYGSFVTWLGENKPKMNRNIFFTNYFTNNIIQITDSIPYPTVLYISGQKVIWVSEDIKNRNRDVFVWQGNKVIQQYCGWIPFKNKQNKDETAKYLMGKMSEPLIAEYM